MKKWLNFRTAIIIVSFIITILPCSGNTNLAVNPSFDEEDGSMPRGWQTVLSRREPGVTEFIYENSGGHSGGKFITIVNHSINDARLKQEISIKENSLYKISCWIKTQNLDANQKGANISLDGRLETSMDIRGTNGRWEYNELYVKTGTGVGSMTITVGIGGYGSETTGQASFDDVVVEEIGIPEGAAVARLGNFDPPKNAPPAIDFSSIGGPTVAIWVLIIAAFIVAVSGTIFYIWLIRKPVDPDGTE